jgi:hypothetical protein
VPTAAKPIIAAARASALSNPLTVGTAATGASAGRGAAAAIAVGRGATGAAAPARGGAGAAACAGAAVLKVGAGAAAGAVGPPGGSVGNLIVGAADGFGGKLIRTVSFLGWTLPVSFLGGTAPCGIFGILSGINKIVVLNLWVGPRGVNLYSTGACSGCRPGCQVAGLLP